METAVLRGTLTEHFRCTMIGPFKGKYIMATDPNRPIVLTDYLTDIEAQLLIGYLEDSEIPAFHGGIGGNSGWPNTGGYAQVIVRACDLDRARIAMAQMQSEPDPEEDFPGG